MVRGVCCCIVVVLKPKFCKFHHGASLCTYYVGELWGPRLSLSVMPEQLFRVLHRLGVEFPLRNSFSGGPTWGRETSIWQTRRKSKRMKALTMSAYYNQYVVRPLWDCCGFRLGPMDGLTRWRTRGVRMSQLRLERWSLQLWYVLLVWSVSGPSASSDGTGSTR